MSLKDICLAVFVILIWASNLVVQKVAVGQMDVLILNFCRLFIVFPFLFFVKKPTLPLYNYLIAGLFWSSLNYTFIGLALKQGINTNISAFLMQANVFFGLLCSYLFLKEKLKLQELIGLLIACVGIFLISQPSCEASTPVTGLLLLLCASTSWGIGLSLLKKFKIGSNFADVLWLSFSSSLPLLIIIIYSKGYEEIIVATRNFDSNVILCILYSTLLSSLLASYIWMGLLQRYTSSKIVSYMLLLPIFTCILATIFLNETISYLQLIAGLIIMFGIYISNKKQFLI